MAQHHRAHCLHFFIKTKNSPAAAGLFWQLKENLRLYKKIAPDLLQKRVVRVHKKDSLNLSLCL